MSRRMRSVFEPGETKVVVESLRPATNLDPCPNSGEPELLISTISRYNSDVDACAQSQIWSCIDSRMDGITILNPHHPTIGAETHPSALVDCIPGSFNGRTRVFGALYRGSNPCPGAIFPARPLV